MSFRFKDHINSNPVAAVLSTEELLKLRSEVAASPPGVSTIEAIPKVTEAGKTPLTEQFFSSCPNSLFLRQY